MTRYKINHLTILFTDNLPHSAEEVQAYHNKAIRLCPSARMMQISDMGDGVMKLRFTLDWIVSAHDDVALLVKL